MSLRYVKHSRDYIEEAWEYYNDKERKITFVGHSVSETATLCLDDKPIITQPIEFFETLRLLLNDIYDED